MPILDAETNRYPEHLFGDFAEKRLPDEEDRNWFVLTTKPRQEKAAARTLLSKELPFYLPLLKKDNLIRGRRVRSMLPLFAGYVFLFGDDYECLEALKTNRISQMLPVPDQTRLWNELRQIKQLIEAEAPMTLEGRLQAGRKVRIKSGAMKGLEGTILARRRKPRLLVAVHFLQAGVSIEIDDYMLEPLDWDKRQ